MMEQTIAAVSTGHAASGIHIIRISGPEAIRIGDRVFAGRKPLGKVKSHTIHHGFIRFDGEDYDEVLVSVMKAPHTYTGEDTVEINCHGGLLVTNRVLELVLSQGARLAEPGEFTKRAFLNGKMDLTRAEAVADLIGAENRFAVKASLSQLKGTLERKVREMRTRILDEVAYIEAALDDPEHYDLDGYGETLSGHVREIHGEIRELLRTFDSGKILKEGIRTVIAGLPNAGKSSLLNLLSGSERAIVTPVAGTTRDVLEVPVRLGDISLLLMDTAGLRKTGDPVEQIGVDRAEKAIREADLVLYVTDSEKGFLPEDREILKTLDPRKVIVLSNKTDLLADHSPAGSGEPIPEAYEVLPFSALTGEGLETLEDAVLKRFLSAEIIENEQVFVTNLREKMCLQEAEESLVLVEEGILCAVGEEVLTIDLMNAYTALGKIIGESVGEDVIDRIFEKFCMGK
ncbi:MAG: tRNA uridine-5-carboxymethylaminomethyl(34) synthesis GTPase MnmE [Lachnospiraceae bacterium]|nr:tRNA uridine-5-carboxymethylaminomethyl(34) synthesis GTPase MnmE [Lachnospiraceae bacterium]